MPYMIESIPQWILEKSLEISQYAHHSICSQSPFCGASRLSCPSHHRATSNSMLAVGANNWYVSSFHSKILLTTIARGTTEPPNPTYGIIVGDPLFGATQKLIPNVTGYAVNVCSDLHSRKDSRSLIFIASILHHSLATQGILGSATH